MSQKRDDIYQQPLDQVEGFVFDSQVASVFDDMIVRSVPLYIEVQRATAQLAARFARPNTRIYDLGCSTGTTLGQLASVIHDPTITFVGVDNSEAMLEQCKHKLAQMKPGDGPSSPIELQCAGIEAIVLESASVIVLNYTLQFIAPEKRQAILEKIHAALVPGGICLISEKVRHEHPETQSVLTDLHHDFKRRNGYSELEIAQKRDSLENVLVPLTAEQNAELCREAGFTSAEAFLKWYTFVSLLAVKA